MKKVELEQLEEINMRRNSDGYKDLLDSIRQTFENHTKDLQEPLFTTDVGSLYDVFLEHIPEEEHQHYNCAACRRFVNNFGGLVRLDENGKQYPVMWSEDIPDFFKDAVKAVRKKVMKAQVTGVFVTSKAALGTPVTGVWHHMAVVMPKAMVYGTDRFHTASQAAAEKEEDYRILGEAVSKYRLDTVETAVNLLRSDQLYRSEKVLGVAEWFLTVLRAIKGKGKEKASSILWYYTGTAPVGFCHVSSSMIGTLLDDIESGYDLDTVSRRFSAKMNPLQYQRPQAAPSAGNVAQAEKIVAKLGIANALTIPSKKSPASKAGDELRPFPLAFCFPLCYTVTVMVYIDNWI